MKQLTGAIFAMMLSFTSQASLMIYSGTDDGAVDFASMLNSQAAAASFDTATQNLSIIDFESALPVGVSITGGSTQNTVPGSFNLYGGNTTSGGSFFRYGSGTWTFDFTTGIDSFGAYFAGLQGNVVGQQTITYSNGSSMTVNIPQLTTGGAFVGFTDLGESITQLSFNFINDLVTMDDVRFGVSSSTPTSVPEPSSLIILALGLLGFTTRRLRK